MTTPQDFGFAHPGDPDLDIDIDNLTLFGLLILDTEVSFQLHGGVGLWSMPDESPIPAGPDPKDWLERASGTITVGFPPSIPAYAREWYLSRLRRWETLSTPLRMLSSPGRSSTLMEDNETWVMIPRSKDPQKRVTLIEYDSEL
jgi:hypothetical protein